MSHQSAIHVMIPMLQILKAYCRCWMPNLIFLYIFTKFIHLLTSSHNSVAQVSEYADVAFTAITAVNPVTKGHPWATWPDSIQVKALYYRSLAQYYMSVAALRESKYGDQVFGHHC
jgi:hypothetical protein